MFAGVCDYRNVICIDYRNVIHVDGPPACFFFLPFVSVVLIHLLIRKNRPVDLEEGWL